MARKKTLFWMSRFALLVLGMIAAVSCTQTAPGPKAPTIQLSTTSIPFKGFIDVKGSGFSPQADLISHLKKPSGAEYPTILMLSDAKGEITHEIDTLLLMIGTHELWIIDTKTGVSSNVAKFEVTTDQLPSSR